MKRKRLIVNTESLTLHHPLGAVKGLLHDRNASILGLLMCLTLDSVSKQLTGRLPCSVVSLITCDGGVLSIPRTLHRKPRVVPVKKIVKVRSRLLFPCSHHNIWEIRVLRQRCSSLGVLFGGCEFTFEGLSVLLRADVASELIFASEVSGVETFLLLWLQL